MDIRSLPIELRLLIAELLDPYQCFDFSLTCKHNWSACAPLVAKHRRLFEENAIIDTTTPRGTLQPILWDRLKRYLDHPCEGTYVRDIILPSARSAYLDVDVSHDFQLSEDSPAPPPEDIERYLAAALVSQDLYTQADPATFDYWIRKGSSEPILNLLIHWTPNLRTFRFTDLELHNAFFTLLRSIALGNGLPYFAPKLPFQHLTTVAVAHWDTEMCCSPEWCQYFCSMPSVRNFVASAMGGLGLEAVHRLPDSNVRELVFHNSRLDARTIAKILQKTHRLERFTYDVGGLMVTDEVNSIEPDTVLKALVTHASHSLRHAVFTVYGDELDKWEQTVTYLCLRDFKQLKTLRIDWRILRECDTDDPDDCFSFDYAERIYEFRNRLPASLEVLVLTGEADEFDLGLLAPLRSGANEFTPLLKEVHLPDKVPEILDPGTNPLMKYLEGLVD